MKKPNTGTGNPAPQKKPPAEKRRGYPTCFRCKKAKAKALDCEKDAWKCSLFCSEDCAIAHAIENVMESAYGWCLTHKEWTDEKGHCRSCKREKSDKENYLLYLFPEEMS